MTRFLVVPQWQGSPSSRAMCLIDGAEAIAGDLPSARCTRIEVPAGAGEALDTGIRRFSSLTRARDAVAEALAISDEPALIVGGDCGVAVPGIAHAAARHGTVAVLWFDAHGDLHSPETSRSGAFSGMALRSVCHDDEFSPAAVAPERIVLAGARDLDDAEEQLLSSSGIRHLSVNDLADPEAVAEAVHATGATSVYIHVDLDVLDPASVTGVASTVPFGVDLPTLTTAITAVRARVPLIGSSVAGFSPATPAAAIDDLGTILRIIGALA